MAHYHLLLTHWISQWYTTIFYWPRPTGYPSTSPIRPLLSLWYTTIFYWPTAYPYGTRPSPPDISMVHYYLLLAHWISLLYTTSPIGSLAFLMVHYTILLANLLSIWYTTIFYWPNGYPYGTLSSPTGPLDISIYTSIFYLPAEYLFGTLPSPIGLLAIIIVHSYLLLANLVSQWYTPLSN